MSVKAYSQYSYACEAYNIDVYFEYKNSIVHNTDKEIIGYDGLSQNKCRELIVITECDIDQYNGPTELARYCRGNILEVQGIISFFTGFPLTVYNSYSQSAGITPIEYNKQEIHLIIDDIDYTSDLTIMLKRISEEPKLIISLLDRWRKAIYLKKESCDADLYYDEATLSFFHILELFGESVINELTQKLKENIDNMLVDHFKAYYYSDRKVTEMVNQNKKSVYNILLGEHLNLAIKIKFFLEKYELLDENIAFFVDSMIKVRNSIAHGRITYQDKFIWPLPPFFNLSKDSYDNIDFLFFMTAVMISKYIGIDCWKEEWEETKIYLLPPKDIVDDFLDNKLVIDTMSTEMLYKGNPFNITWRTVFNYYVKNPKDMILEKIEKKFKEYFINAQIDEENAPDIFNISLIFSDSDDESLKEKSCENVKSIIKKDWFGWSNIKDAYSYLDFYNVNVKWYRDFLDNKEYLSLREHNE